VEREGHASAKSPREGRGAGADQKERESSFKKKTKEPASIGEFALYGHGPAPKKTTKK